ncbi:MAG: hypothetical protein JNK26_04370 [Candidatus Doudnabacteria bacterium]|nr:hypothetical protein [Candidatus Doudnabacteria bacterium]
MWKRTLLTTFAVLFAAQLAGGARLFSPVQVKAEPNYAATSGQLVVGTNAATSAANTGSWQGTIGNDGNYWLVNRVAAATSLNLQVRVTGVNLQNANKLILTFEDSNVTTATAYQHEICDWVSSTGVDAAADSECTGGGWRNLNPRKSTYNNTAETSRVYELYDGYFWNISASPGTPISTPLSNFVSGGTQAVLVRVVSNVSATTQYYLEWFGVEPAIDPIYEPADITLTAAGTTTNYVRDLIGANATGVVGSDGNKLTIPMSAINQAIDARFVFKNVRNYTGANTFLVMPEICVSNVALTFNTWLYDYNSTTWTQLANNVTGTACTTDTEYAYSFNADAVPGFNLANHISNNEMIFRITTNAPGTVYNLQLDRIYAMLGSVNSNSSQCEISWGTGTASNCTNTRTVNAGKTVATTPTWQATAALEYPSSFYGLDNDDDATGAEYAASQNLSFPITVSSGMQVSAIHYAAKYRSNSTAQTADLGIKDFSGLQGTSGWNATPGTDTNALTTYSWFDTWTLAEYQSAPEFSIDTVNNLANLRLRTSAGTTTNPGTRDWAFAMMSIRWVEPGTAQTRKVHYLPTGANLALGNGVATSVSNTGSWQGALGNDGNYWQVARNGGLNLQLMFDGVEIYGANKLILTVEDSNVTTGDAYLHQVCDWVSNVSVDNAADANCTGGGWRTVNMRGVAYTNTADTTRTYEIYDGFFSTRSATPGTVVSTPLTNFIQTGTNRFLVRSYSTVLSTVNYVTDYMHLEVGIDPIYEPAGITAINNYVLNSTNFISDLVQPGASDANKFVLTNNATNPLDVYFSFKNVNTYTGMNTILVKPEVCVSNVALTWSVWVYNFSTVSWQAITTGGPITGTACATDTAYAFALNNITIGDYISAGEMRIRFSTATLSTNTLQIDRLYLMLGSTNVDSGLCEISWGTGTAGNCTNTRDILTTETGSTSTNTWQQTAVLEYPTTFYGGDNDDDATNAESASASNLAVPVSLSSAQGVTAIHYAGRARSNVTTMTTALGVRDFSGRIGGNGWTAVGTTNALTTYTWTDSWQSAELQLNAPLYVNLANSMMNLRLRTSASTLTSAGTVRDWDFLMGSIRYIGPAAGPLTVDIVDAGGSSVASPSVGFSNLVTVFECQDSTGTLGVSAEKIRVTNSTFSPSWSLSIGATGGETATWAATGASYDYNDNAGTPTGCGDGGDADALAGRLTLNPAVATITPQVGCSNTGISLGTNNSFLQGTLSSINLMQAGGTASTGCYWDLTGVGATQQVPADQPAGTYTINMTLTLVAI